MNHKGAKGAKSEGKKILRKVDLPSKVSLVKHYWSIALILIGKPGSKFILSFSSFAYFAPLRLIPSLLRTNAMNHYIIGNVLPGRE
ncbi:MAG: hypothetical protein QNJ51_08195 [Calothrix sp. MO_167.B12]|nr:hypothetical protein [Calothrix sp. MO_167.B12]